MKFEYYILNTFNFGGFLSGCNSVGIKLYADGIADSVNGNIEAGGGFLNVNLYENDEIHEHSASYIRLPGDLIDYKPTIDAKVAEFNV